MRVVLGVAGGIAAYKACSLLRLLTEAGHDVTVVPTAAALEFVGAPTWSALSGKPVAIDVWSDVHEVPHVRLGQQADLVVVAPATADLLARAATGQADDLLTNVLLTARCPVVMAPAMHTEMWEHPATVANVATLAERGVHIVPPASGRLTGADSGPGRLPEADELYAVCERELSRAASARRDLVGRHVVISAGGTREPLDPVRYLGNRSSGKQGHALAVAAAGRGAQVTLVTAAPTDAPLRARDGIVVHEVESALEMRDAVAEAARAADVVVMAAAVADFRPAHYQPTKIKKSSLRAAEDDDNAAPTVELARNPDILRELVSARGSAQTPMIVGFAAETGDGEGSVLEHARAKLERKGCDLLVVNEVGRGVAFGTDDNAVTILARGGETVLETGSASKAAISDAVWDAVVARWGSSALSGPRTPEASTR